METKSKLTNFIFLFISLNGIGYYYSPMYISRENDSLHINSRRIIHYRVNNVRFLKISISLMNLSEKK